MDSCDHGWKGLELARSHLRTARWVTLAADSSTQRASTQRPRTQRALTQRPRTQHSLSAPSEYSISRVVPGSAIGLAPDKQPMST